MDHRHVFSATQTFESESDQGWNHAQHPYMPTARTAASGSSSHSHPMTDVSIPGGYFPSQRNHVARPNEYSSSVYNGEFPYQQSLVPPGPSHDPFLYQSSTGTGNSHMLQDNFSHHPPQSNFAGQAAPGLQCGLYNPTMVSGRGSYKRKTPHFERGSTSTYYDAGSSSNAHLPVAPWQEKQNTETYHAPWVYPPNYRPNNLSIGNEGTVRNVRSRVADEMDANLPRTHNSVHHLLPARSSGQFNSAELWGPNSTAPPEWNSNLIPSAGHGVNPVSESTFFSQQSSQIHVNGSINTGVCHNDLTSIGNPVSQNVNNNMTHQPVRGVQSGYSQRPVPVTYRGPTGNFHSGHMATSEEMIPERYPPRHPRTFPSMRFRNIDRNVRISSDRYRSFVDEANVAEGMMVDHPAFHGSRTLFDQHRDMRLDIDDMSYEDLLALEERIGNVNTGLSDTLVSKCMTESIYCSSDITHDEGTCVICLDEYKYMEDVGTLKVCRHDFHVSCIRKWLAMKNSCPICKAAVVDDGGKTEI